MYLYETHLHTSPVSRCALWSVREAVEYYKNAGYAGIFITNHFIDGHINIPKDRPYEERINYYFSDAEEGIRIGKEIGLPVFTGVEMSHFGTDFLVYGLEKSWYLAHPEIEMLTKTAALALMKEAGALVIQAHPFRDRDYIKGIHLAVNDSDGIEAVNTANRPGDNLLALAYGKKFGKVLSAGSDIHDVKNVRAGVGAIGFETPLADEKDFATRILRGEGPALVYDKAFFDGAEADLRLPVEEYKEAGSVPISHQEVLSWLKEVNL